jgi:hypothetical protein
MQGKAQGMPQGPTRGWALKNTLRCGAWGKGTRAARAAAAGLLAEVAGEHP